MGARGEGWLGAAGLGLSIALSGCVDVGYPARSPPPEPRRDAASEAPDGCVEGPAEPSTEGPQLVFSSLDVDQHLVRVAPGEAVTWTNASNATHTATAGAPGAPRPAEEGGFDSGVIVGGGGRWAWRFCDPRAIEWYCKTHPAQMYGYRILVE